MTFVTKNMPAGLVNELKAMAKLPRAPRGYLPALAAEYGYAVKSLGNALWELRGDRRLDEDQGIGGAASTERADVAVSPHSPAASALAVPSPRAVVPAAGAMPPVPCGRVGDAPAAVLSCEEPPAPSPGMCWARSMLERGIPLATVLRKGGDALTFRDRIALRGGAHA